VLQVCCSVLQVCCSVFFCRYLRVFDTLNSCVLQCVCVLQRVAGLLQCVSACLFRRFRADTLYVRVLQCVLQGVLQYVAGEFLVVAVCFSVRVVSV